MSCLLDIIFLKGGMIIIDVDKITLTKAEKRLLRKIYKSKKYPKEQAPSSELYNLLRFELVDYNHLPTPKLGVFPIDGTVSVTANYERYKKINLSKFIERKIPVILSVIAIIISIIALIKP